MATNNFIVLIALIVIALLLINWGILKRFGKLKLYGKTIKMFKECKSLITTESFAKINLLKFWWFIQVRHKWSVIKIPGKQVLPYALLIIKRVDRYSLQLKHHYLYTKTDESIKDIKSYLDDYFVRRAVENIDNMYVYLKSNDTKQIELFKDEFKFEDEEIYSNMKHIATYDLAMLVRKFYKN